MRDEDPLEGEQQRESESDPDGVPTQDVQGYEDEDPWDGTDEESGWLDESSFEHRAAAAWLARSSSASSPAWSWC